jgi:hypothetical protein
MSRRPRRNHGAMGAPKRSGSVLIAKTPSLKALGPRRTSQGFPFVSVLASPLDLKRNFWLADRD